VPTPTKIAAFEMKNRCKSKNICYCFFRSFFFDSEYSLMKLHCIKSSHDEVWAGDSAPAAGVNRG